ncbi:MAG: type II toxin-antitoxin system RelE/ParE family toxin, partial [Thermoanaerobaculales bacterium]|nr:type II toxin-antitoxin system RelE/ParE family toxin [Thermoanaerobaculales bacterium]
MYTDQKDRRPYDILWSDRAKADLGEIGDYIAADSPIAAKRWIDRL